MDKEKMTSDKQETAESLTHKESFAERCKECGAIPLSQFEKEVSDAINEGYKKFEKII